MGKKILFLLSIILVNIFSSICKEKSTEIHMQKNAKGREMRNLEDKTCDNYISGSFGEMEVSYKKGYDQYGCRNYVNYIEFNEIKISNPKTSFNLPKGINIKYCFNSSVTSLENFFGKGCEPKYFQIESIDLGNFDSTKLTKMNSMFYGCKNLKSIVFPYNFNTSSVVNMSELFYQCSSLEVLNLKSFQTTKVTNMASMFNGCSKLKSIDLSNFDTSSVLDMKSMFQECQTLNSIDLSNFNTSLVKNMALMFNKCYALISLDLSKFITSSVTNMNKMFQDCSSLNSINILIYQILILHQLKICLQCLMDVRN